MPGNGRVTRIACFLGQPATAQTLSGGDRHAFEVWARWAARPDVELQVIACHAGAALAESFGHRFKTTRTESKPSTIGRFRFGYVGRCLRALRQVKQLRDIDLVYSETPFFYDVLPAIAAKFSGRARRVVVPLYHLTPPPALRSGNGFVNLMAWLEQRIMLRLIAGFADSVLVAYPAMIEQLVKNGIPRQRIVVSGMGALSGLPPKSPAEFDAISVGRLAPAKGIEALLDAWVFVQRERPGATLALVGGDMPGFDVDREIERRSLQRCVSVHRAVSDQRLLELMRASSTFITASTEEGYGIAVGEALAAGLPCVTFDLPVFRVVFPYGRLAADEGTAEGLGRAALQLMSDLGLRARLRDEAARCWRHPSWDEVADALWSACL